MPPEPNHELALDRESALHEIVRTYVPPSIVPNEHEHEHEYVYVHVTTPELIVAA